MMIVTCQRCKGAGEIPAPHYHPNTNTKVTCRDCGGTGITGSALTAADPGVPCGRLEAGLELYIKRYEKETGFFAGAEERSALAWAHSRRPEIGTEIAPCVHSWFARPAGNWRCAHCGMTIDLPANGVRPRLSLQRMVRLRLCKCGGEPKEKSEHGCCWVECDNCGRCTLVGPSRKVRRQWNKGEAA